MSRFFHFTYHKSGSQWIRDLIAYPPLLQAAGVQMHTMPGIEHRNLWHQFPPGSFTGAIYHLNTEIWAQHANGDDQAIIVWRDPRDICVSWIYSKAYSHDVSNQGESEVTRSIMRCLPLEVRTAAAILFAEKRFVELSKAIESLPLPNLVPIPYEKWNEDALGCLSGLLTRWNWDVPSHLIEEAVDKFDFRKSSGREKGVEEPLSHLRKGITGDWRNHFSREDAVFFETMFPGLLVRLGYEISSDWVDTVADSPDLNSRLSGDFSEDLEGRRALVRLKERILTHFRSKSRYAEAIDELLCRDINVTGVVSLLDRSISEG
jgi:hypothetical protein